MSDGVINPFAGDPDRSAIWDMLLARDSDAFAAADWPRVANDFAADRFEGISANGSAEPFVFVALSTQKVKSTSSSCM